MIQGFAHQVHTFTSTQNKVNLKSNEATSKNAFNNILDNQSKNEKPSVKDNKTSHSDLARSQNAAANSRRVEVKNEEPTNSNKEAKKETTVKAEEVMTKEEKTVEELVENLNNLLAVFQNIIAIETIDLENINLEELNLEVSIDELQGLMMSLENLSQVVDLGESEEQVQSMIANLGKMIEDVAAKGQIEIPAEEFVVELKEVMTLVNSQADQVTDKNLSKEMENSSSKLEEIINVIGKPEETKDTKNTKNKQTVKENVSQAEIKLDQTDKNIKTVEPLVDVPDTSIDSKTLEDVDFKITLVTGKKEGIDISSKFGNINTLDLDTDLVEDINPRAEDVPANILAPAQTQISAEETSKITNNTIINPEQYMNIDKTDVLRQITNRVKTDYETEMNEIKIKLSPEHLGELTIKISLERGVLSARALVENTNVKQMLENNLDDLKKSLADQGMEFASIDVSVGKDSNFDEQSPNFFAQDKRINRLKTKVSNLDSSLDTNYYEDLDENNSSSILGVGQRNMDITI